MEGSTKGLRGKHAQGRSWHNTAPTAAPELWQRTRVKICSPLIGKNNFVCRRNLKLNLNLKTNLAVVVSYWYLNHLAWDLMIFFLLDISFFKLLPLPTLHPLCRVHWGLLIPDWGKGQGGTGRDTQMDTGQTTTWKSLDCIHSPSTPSPDKVLPPHQGHKTAPQPLIYSPPPKIYLAIFDAIFKCRAESIHKAPLF